MICLPIIKPFYVCENIYGVLVIFDIFPRLPIFWHSVCVSVREKASTTRSRSVDNIINTCCTYSSTEGNFVHVNITLFWLICSAISLSLCARCPFVILAKSLAIITDRVMSENLRVL